MVLASDLFCYYTVLKCLELEFQMVLAAIRPNPKKPKNNLEDERARRVDGGKADVDHVFLWKHQSGNPLTVCRPEDPSSAMDCPLR